MSNIHPLFISRPPKQVNHGFRCRLLVSLDQMKGPRSKDIHLLRRINSNLFVGKSKTGLKELSITFACKIWINSWIKLERE